MKYSVTNSTHKNLHTIKIEEGEFKGCEYIYGPLSFDPVNEGLLHFDYEIVNMYNVTKDQMDRFVNTLGDLLVQIIEESMANNEVIFTGGVDSD